MNKRSKTSTHPVETSTHPVETSTNLSNPSETLTYPAVIERLEDARHPGQVQRDINILRLVNKEMNTALEKPCESQLYESLDDKAKKKHKDCLETRHYNQRIVSDAGPSEFPLDYGLWESSSDIWKFPGLWKSHVLCQIRKSLYRDKRTVVSFGVLPDTIARFVSDILQDESMKCIIKNFTTRIYVMNRKTPPKEDRTVYRGVIDLRDFSKEKDCIQTINTLKDGLEKLRKENIKNRTPHFDIDAVQIGIGRQSCDKHSVYNFTDEAYKSVQIIGYEAFRYLIGDGSDFTPKDTLKLSIFTALTHIGSKAFYNVMIKPDFSNLARLTFIGYGAFFSLEITPDFSDLVGLTQIGDFAFAKVKQVPNFEHLRKLTTIGAGAFESVSEAGELGDSPNFSNLVELTHIESRAFKNCKFQRKAPDFTNLKKLRTIGFEAFKSLVNMPDLTHQVKLERIEGGAFENAQKVPNFKELRNLRYIGQDTFRNAEGTPDFTYLRKLKSIGNRAFANITVTETLKSQVVHLIRTCALEMVAFDAFPPHVGFHRVIEQELNLRRLRNMGSHAFPGVQQR